MKTGTFVLTFMLFCSAQPLTGQVGSPSTQRLSMVSGRVFDRNGAVVVGSEVSLSGDRGSTFATVTNDEGIYRIDLPAGFYDLQIRADGFSTFRLECYQIPSAGQVSLDVTLSVNDESGCVYGMGKDCQPSPRVKKRKTIVIE